MTQRLKATIAYDGTHYEGWQVQACTHRKEPPTIQGELERILKKMTGGHIAVHGSGRTDSGVHAEGQVCHFDVPSQTAFSIDWQKALNAQLPPDIRVLNITRADSNFHARKDALEKTYVYTLWAENAKPLPRLAPYCWGTPPLCLDAMLRASGFLIGTHDFAGLQNSGVQLVSTVRTLTSITPILNNVMGLTCPEHWPVISWHVTGTGFLKQMVRNIIGLMVWSGLGKLSPEDVPGLLKQKDRKAFPSPTAPARGLTLLRVVYPECGGIEISSQSPQCP